MFYSIIQCRNCQAKFFVKFKEQRTRRVGCCCHKCENQISIVVMFQEQMTLKEMHNFMLAHNENFFNQS